MAAVVARACSGAITVQGANLLIVARPYNSLMATAAEGLAEGASTVYEQVLDNGLRVLIQEVHTAPLATVWAWYRVGSKDEGPGLTGVSHWVEHMNFRGSTNIPREKVKGIIERFGGYWNGYTWIDQTTYTETATRDALDHMLFIESERMGACLYDPADCEAERTIIISELQGGENDPDQLLDQELTATAFRAHSYRHPTIGWLSDLQTMGRDDLFGHYRRFYVPNNATLVIVGDVDRDSVMRDVVKRFGAIAPGDVGRRPRTIEPEQIGQRRVTISKPGTTAYLKIAHHSPAAGDPQFFPLLVLDAALTGAKGVNLWASFRTPPPQRSARLYQALVNTGLASGIGGSIVPTQEPFLYTISATATEGTTLTALEDAAVAEIERVAREGITPHELKKAKTQLRARLVFENDSITNIAHQLGYFATISNWRDYPSLAACVESVTLDQVSEVAARRLNTSQRTIGWFSPAPQ
jgi:zinc protease